MRLRSRIVDLLDEKDRLENTLDDARHTKMLEVAKETEAKLHSLELGEDRLFRELERLTLLAERTDSAFWRWLMFCFAFINILVTVANFWIHLTGGVR